MQQSPLCDVTRFTRILEEALHALYHEMDVAYNSPAGPVTPYDIQAVFTGRDKPFMAHHSGFTLKVLMGTVVSNGFLSVGGKRRPAAFDLWVVATKMKTPEEQLRVLAEQVLPVS